MSDETAPQAPATSATASPLAPREELASIAASLRAYLEWQHDTGATGIPRKPRAARARPADPRPIEAHDDARQEAPRAAVAIGNDEPDYDPPPAGQFDDDVPVDPPPTRDAAPARAPAQTRPAAPAPRAPLPSPFDPPPAAPPARAPGPASAPSAPSPSAPSRPPRALDVIADEVRGCQKCALGATRTNTVFSRGNPSAKLCFIGEAPGADEDAQGIPFVGRAGQLLDKMIQAMGLDPERDVYICNIVKCRPPGNRRPEPNETEACIPYLHEQVANVDPKVIVALGNTAVGTLLGTKLGITKVRGQWKLYRGKIPVMPTYHPSYLLRPSAQLAEAKRQAWDDLQAVMKELGLSRK